MMDELDGNTLLEFIGLRVKLYAFRQIVDYANASKNLEDGEMLQVKKLKGIQRSVVKKTSTLTTITSLSLIKEYTTRTRHQLDPSN